jgi:hypothetical protein
MLATLFSTLRKDVLAATLTQPQKWWYLSELTQFLRTSPSSLQRELTRWSTAASSRRGERALAPTSTSRWTCGPDFPSCAADRQDRRFVANASDRPPASGDAHRLCFVYGSVARSEEHATSDIDLPPGMNSGARSSHLACISSAGKVRSMSAGHLRRSLCSRSVSTRAESAAGCCRRLG